MIGSVLSNRYELVENIGAGGMAIVYKAKCRLLNRYVAIKVLRPEFQEDSEFLMRFNIEAQSAGSLSHPNVVSVYDVGQHGKLNYIVMELVEGITLKEYLSKKESLSVNEAIDFSLQIASALEHAHSKGIIHRDIKPHNIIITNEGVLKVTDFGLARAATSSTIVAGSAMGSVHYVSPEQAKGSFTDERTDIYSLGIVMYELFAGVLPFDGDTPISVAMKHIEKEPQAPSEINPQIPEYIENIILRALSKDPGKRYSKVAELIQDIKHYDSPDSDGSNKFSTKKLPSLKSELEKAVKHEEKNKKRDTLTIVSAIVSAVIVMSIITFFVAKLFFPDGLFTGSKTVIVPELINQSYDDVLEKYKDSKDIVIVETQRINSDKYFAGVIIDQSPAAGEKVKNRPCTVNVTISMGPKITTLKDYVGQDYRMVEKELADLGLDVRISEEFNDEYDVGEIVRHNPSADYQVSSGNTIFLYVSKGKNEREVSMPDLIGKTDADARNILKENDLSIGIITKEQSNYPENIVISQSVNAGDMVSTQTAINYSISTGKPIISTSSTARITLELPSDKDTTHVKLQSGSSILYEGTFSTENSPITIDFKVKNDISTVDVYYDDAIAHKNMSISFQ